MNQSINALKELQEHVDALELAIQWCMINRADVRFMKNGVYVRIGGWAMYAPTFLQAVEAFRDARPTS